MWGNTVECAGHRDTHLLMATERSNLVDRGREKERERKEVMSLTGQGSHEYVEPLLILSEVDHEQAAESHVERCAAARVLQCRHTTHAEEREVFTLKKQTGSHRTQSEAETEIQWQEDNVLGEGEGEEVYRVIGKDELYGV